MSVRDSILLLSNGVSLREGTLTASVVESDLSDYPDLSASARSFFTPIHYT